MSRILAAAALAASCLAIPAFADEADVHDPDGVDVHGAYAVVSRPGAPSGGAYMVIHNHAAADDRLLSASATVAEMVQIHENIIDDEGVARMRELADGIPLPAGGEIILSRGGDHVMFMGITEPFEDGMIIPLTLQFEVAGDLLVEVPVDLSRLSDGHDMHDHDHEGDHGHDMDHHTEGHADEHDH